MLSECTRALFLNLAPILLSIFVHSASPFASRVTGSFYGMLTDNDYWFLPTLFFLRVLVIPFISKMRTRSLPPLAKPVSSHRTLARGRRPFCTRHTAGEGGAGMMAPHRMHHV